MRLNDILKRGGPYGACGLIGAAIGFGAGWLLCSKKMEKKYMLWADEQINAYKKRVEERTRKILEPFTPSGEEVVSDQEAKSVVVSDPTKFERTPEDQRVRYDQMYKGGGIASDSGGKTATSGSRVVQSVLRDRDEDDTDEGADRQRGEVDSQRMNDIPRDRSGRIRKGGTEITRTIFEDSLPEDRVYLDYYTEDDVLADPDGDIWDTDDTFGNDLEEFIEDPDTQEIYMNSNYFTDKVFRVTKKKGSYTEMFDTLLDDLLYGEE
jgi:hypothetical protein